MKGRVGSGLLAGVLELLAAVKSKGGNGPPEVVEAKGGESPLDVAALVSVAAQQPPAAALVVGFGARVQEGFVGGKVGQLLAVGCDDLDVLTGTLDFCPMRPASGMVDDSHFGLRDVGHATGRSR